MESDSVSSFDAAEIEDIIVSEIRRLQATNKRADFSSVSHAAESKHGLAKSVSISHMKRMITKNIIKVVMRGGAESFRFVEKEQSIENKNDENPKRKVSDDEEKISECREGLIKEAATFATNEYAQIKQQQKVEKSSRVSNKNEEDSFSECRESLVQEEEKPEHIQNTKEHRGSGREDDLSISSDVSCDDVLEYADAIWGGATRCDVVNDTTSRRLDEIERKVNEIVSRINDADQDKRRDDEGKRFEEMLIRLGKLEGENRILKDENIALKLENCDLRNELSEKSNLQQKAKYENVPAKEDPWKFPNTIARPRNQTAVSFVSSNRFSPLDCISENGMNPRSQIHVPQNGEKMQHNIQPMEINSEKYRGARPRSEKDSVLTRDHEQMRNSGNAQQESHKIRISSESHGEGIPPIVNKTAAVRENTQFPPGNIASTEISYSTALQRNSPRGQSAAARSAMHGGGETSKYKKQRETEISNRFGPNRQSQHYQREDYPARGQKPKFIIVGDSMTKKIRRKEINDEARNYHVLVKSFPGATVEKMKFYLEPEIMSNPEGVIIHCGTNNLRNESPESVANKIVDLAMETKKRTQYVAVSSLVLRTDSKELDAKRAKINTLLERYLERLPVDYIMHENILSKHLDNWGLHLNFQGTNIMTVNFLSYLNYE